MLADPDTDEKWQEVADARDLVALLLKGDALKKKFKAAIRKLAVTGKLGLLERRLKARLVAACHTATETRAVKPLVRHRHIDHTRARHDCTPKQHS